MTPHTALRLADEVDEVAQTYPDMAEVSDCIRQLVAQNQIKDALIMQAVKALEDVRDNVTSDSPYMWERVFQAISSIRGA